MQVDFGTLTVNFQPWRPEDGQVTDSACAMDTETTLIDMQRPWLTPAYVIGAVYDGRQGWFITRDRLHEFLRAHWGLPLVFHNAPFDLAVIHQLAPLLDIYRRVDLNIVWDTQLLHKLYKLASEGHTATTKGASTLETCAREYLGTELPKDVLDSRGKSVRLSYGQYVNRPPDEIEPVYLEYLAKDTLATFHVWEELQRRISDLLYASGQEWGFVSKDWLAGQITSFGPQTHHIHLKGAIVLQEITSNGLAVDTGSRDELVTTLEQVKEEHLRELQEQGYIPGQKGSNKALQEILKRLDAKHPAITLPRTEKRGDYATSEEALQSLKGLEPFIDSLLAFRTVEKLLSTFLQKMGQARLHPSFNPLVRTGRTSSFGVINAQNLPRDDRIRRCFVPSQDGVFLDADYATIELATLAQSVISQLGLASAMAEAINEGKDLHRLVAARFFDKDESAVTGEERRKAKPINFGKPGGMGTRSLQQYAATSYGVKLSDLEVKALSESWFGLFPEMRDFLQDNVDVTHNLATTLGLTPLGYFQHTDRDTFLKHLNNIGRENLPHPILGAMLLKVVKESSPATGAGRSYTSDEVDYFWTQLAARLDVLPKEMHIAVSRRLASKKLQRSVMREFGRGGVFTYSGRLRAGATFAARHNTMFQGLAADGAKLSLWLLWRAGFKLVNFIHDEVLIELPKTANLTLQAEVIRSLMIQGMKLVVPDVHVDVEYAASRAWSKDAEKRFDAHGRLAA